MTHRASGPFDVTLKPQTDNPSVGDAAMGGVGRMSLDKQFHGDLEAVSKGQMLAVRTAVKGSAGYVAMERVVGTLSAKEGGGGEGGRKGSFVLQHNSTMNKAVPKQSITVVPDSGTDELVGLAGSMTIDIVNGKHFYNFEYRFDAAPNP